MLLRYKTFKQNKIKLLQIVTLLFILCSFPNCAYALDMQDVLENLRRVLAPLMSLLLIISYVGGIFLMFKGVISLKNFGQQTQYRSGDLTGPIIYISVAAVLLYIPSTTDVLTKTIFGQNATSIVNANVMNLEAAGKASDLLGYVSPRLAVEGKWADLADTIILYVQFIGFLNFIRGWFMLSKAGQQGAQPDSVKKGIVHIVGGILAVNFIPLFDVLRKTITGN